MLSLVAVAVSSCAHPAPVVRTAPVTASPPPAGVVAPPPLVLVPADVARTGLAATFVIPSLERSLSRGVDLVKQATPLPLDAGGVRDMMLSQAGLPPEVARHLDLGAPVAGAVVVNGRGPAPLAAFSFAIRSPADVTPLLGALGRTVERRGNAWQIENAAGDRGWFLPLGTVVVFADTDESLVRAGSLAIEARRETKHDASVVLYPEMVARAAGTSLETGLEGLRRTLEERAAAGGNGLGAEGGRQLRVLLDTLADIETAEIALDLDAVQGLSLQARLRPKSGSRLQALARQSATVPVDPGLRRVVMGRDDTGLLLTSAYGESTLGYLGRWRANLPAAGAGPGAAGGGAAGRFLDALAAGMTGQLSMIGRMQPALSAELVFPLVDPAHAAGIEAALLAADRDSLTKLLKAAASSGAGTPPELKDLKVSKVSRQTWGKTRGIQATLSWARPAKENPRARELLGAAGLDVFGGVVGGNRLVLTVGQGAKARLGQIATGDGPAPKTVAAGPPGGAPSGAASPAFLDAIAQAGPRSFFTLLDLRQVMVAASALGGDARYRMLGATVGAAMPLLGGATGDGAGQAFTVDVTIPRSTFSGIGAVLQAAMLTRN